MYRDMFAILSIEFAVSCDAARASVTVINSCGTKSGQ